MMKKWILGIIVGLCLFGLSFAQVNLNPVYTSDRFQPSDKFHAGCENQIDLVFQLDNSKINGVNAILRYDGSVIDILKIVAVGEKENNLTYTVENDKITFSKLKTDGDGLDNVMFSIIFKVGTELQKSSFSFEKGSYVVDSKGNMVDLEGNYNFEFVEVPECDPDIVAPSVELSFPSNKTGDYVALDSYFQFEIDDQGKGVNKDSIKIQIDKYEYTLQNIEHNWSDKILTVYPDFWMPFNTGFEVKISVSDKQSYGKPNTTTKIYEFETSDEMNLLNKINPVEFRKIVNMNNYIKGSNQECSLLSEIYSNFDQDDGEILESINKKLDCGELVFSEKNNSNMGEDIVINNGKDFSVFAMIGWVLFGSLALFMVFSRLRK